MLARVTVSVPTVSPTNAGVINPVWRCRGVSGPAQILFLYLAPQSGSVR